MLLYHYGVEPYFTLLTKHAQGGLSKADIKDEAEAAEFRGDPGSYSDQISFFVEPAPLDILGKLFEGSNNSVWRTGKVLFEHVVDTRTFGDVAFQFVETPTRGRFTERMIAETDLTDAKKKEYFQAMAFAQKMNGEVGRGSTALADVAMRFYGRTRAAYLEAVPREDEIQKRRYACNVPHVMVWPPGGKIPVPRPTTMVTVSGGKPYREGKDSLVKVNDKFYRVDHFLKEAQKVEPEYVPMRRLKIPVPRSIRSAEEMARIDGADLNFPLLMLDSSGEFYSSHLLDGYHRFLKAYGLGKEHILIKRLPKSVMDSPMAKTDISELW